MNQTADIFANPVRGPEYVGFQGLRSSRVRRLFSVYCVEKATKSPKGELSNALARLLALACGCWPTKKLSIGLDQDRPVR
jgi:hypothetical protein